MKGLLATIYHEHLCLFVCLLWCVAASCLTVHLCIFIKWLCSQTEEVDFWVTWGVQKGTGTLKTDQKSSCDWQPGPAELQGAAKARILLTPEHVRRTPLLFECLLFCDSWWLHQNPMELCAFRWIKLQLIMTILPLCVLYLTMICNPFLPTYFLTALQFHLTTMVVRCKSWEVM